VTGNFKTGTDIDVLVGYDFGRIRAEAELSRKHAKFDSVTVRNSFFGSILDGNHDTRGSINALTAVVNVLYDLPVSSTVNLYAGPGIGYGRLKLTPRVDLFDNGTYGDELHTTKRSGAFGQIVAGVRMRVSDRVDVGVKYRFVRSQKLTYDAGVLGDLKGRLTTHSVLLSLGYNFGGARSAAPAPVAEPVEAAPAAPVAEPAAPPPPAPATSGERG
jgi:opacity protein-like surface antigen